jgi:hypothetical protein
MGDKGVEVPRTDCIENIGNISDWLAPFIATMDPTQSRTGITYFHQFCFTPNSSGTNVHMGVKVWPTDVKPFTGLETNTDYHVVFRDTMPRPKASDMAHDVPPAQRKELPVPTGVSASSVDHVREELRLKALQLMTKGVKTCCHARSVPDEAVADLEYCLQLLADREPLPFNWDTHVYRDSEANLLPASIPSPMLSPMLSPDPESDPDDPPELALSVKVGDCVLVMNGFDDVRQPFVLAVVKSLPKLFDEHKDKDPVEYKEIYVW